MNVKKIIIVILMALIMPSISAKALTAVEYIQKIADDAGGDNNSVEAIGDTNLAYDDTVDKNLRFVGAGINNYILFNDELWRIIGIMNNISDENGNAGTYLKIIRKDAIGSYSYDISASNINRGYGINDWSHSLLNKLLNPGNENTINPRNNSQLIYNSLYWNRSAGTCYVGKLGIEPRACDFTTTGLKEESKDLIATVVWNTGTVNLVRSGGDLRAIELYNQERGTAVKCTYSASNFDTICNDNVERKSTYTGKVGLAYSSDVLYSVNSQSPTLRSSCLHQRIYNVNGCKNRIWMDTLMWTLDTPNSSAIVVGQGYSSTIHTYDNNPIYPTVYLKQDTKIVGGSGTSNNPWVIKGSNYSSNTNPIKKTNGNYKGDYSIEYLIKNFNLITFGVNNNNLESNYKSKIASQSGNVEDVSTIEGPVLIQNNLTTTAEKGTFATRNRNDESFIKGTIGTNYSTTSKVISNNDYVDFDKMYAQVVNEQQLLVDKTEHHINKETIEIKEPGIYMINNTSPYFDTATYSSDGNPVAPKKVYIDNYDDSKYYVINIMNLYITKDFEVYIKSSGEPSFYSFNNFVDTGRYTGNIIFNYPNARYIELVTVSGKIIAPKADVVLKSYIINNSYPKMNVNESIFANSIIGDNITVTYHPSTIREKILDETGKQFVEEPVDYDNDLYAADYSLKSLLQNYSIVSFGKKQYDIKSKFNGLSNYSNGSVGLLHIAGQFLVNGDIGIPNITYPENTMRFDLESNLVTESNISGQFKREFRPKYWSRIEGTPKDARFFGTKNELFSGNYVNNYYPTVYRTTEKTFIDYDRLYNNVISEQSNIEEGSKVTSEDVTHIKIGGNYVIEDINEINEIVFDNFADEKDKITIITIKNSGDINFPIISKDEGDYKGIITNDYYGKEEATYAYELDTFVSDSYHGNIIWNLPNATYIQLAANAPFIGHLIAPRADVETPELQFAGCFIVNSLYCEGNTEAHFYPLTIKLDCVNGEYQGMSEDQKLRFSEYRLSKMLGGDGSIIEKKVVGDQEQYKQELELFEKTLETCDTPRIIIVNPKTAGTIGVLISIIAVAFTAISIKTKKYNKLK